MSYFKPIPDENFISDVLAKCVTDLVAVIVLAWYLVLMFGIQVNVEGNSMSPLLNDGDKVLVNQMRFRLFEPERLDTVYIRQQDVNGEISYIKRIVGIPGDTLQIIDGQLYVNGTVLSYQEDREKIVNPGSLETPVTLGRNEYFVLGDNWNNSEDSRFDAVGIVRREDIMGKIWLKTSPFKEIRLIPS